jgi:hypothetical protein
MVYPILDIITEEIHRPQVQKPVFFGHLNAATYTRL